MRPEICAGEPLIIKVELLMTMPPLCGSKSRRNSPSSTAIGSAMKPGRPTSPAAAVNSAEPLNMPALSLTSISTWPESGSFTCASFDNAKISSAMLAGTKSLIRAETANDLRSRR